VVPEVPKKADLLKKPTREDLDKKLDEVDKQIDKVHTTRKAFFEDIKKVQSGIKDKGDTSTVRELRKAKASERKKINEEFKKIQEDHNAKKNEIEKLFEESQKLRLKMKSLDKADDIIRELKGLKDRQQNDQLAANEERNICKRIADLERSLPFAEPLEKIDRQMEILR
jgi:uncharacterized coiled-coil DUF342 family protein